jgi:hypothetical protein
MHQFLVNQRALINGLPGLAWSRECGEGGFFQCYIDGELTTSGEARSDLWHPSQVVLLDERVSGEPPLRAVPRRGRGHGRGGDVWRRLRTGAAVLVVRPRGERAQRVARVGGDGALHVSAGRHLPRRAPVLGSDPDDGNNVRIERAA